jgi:DNA-binding NtrC family response regulator
MIVEDDKNAARVITYQLRDKGYACHHFETAEKALAYFDRHPVDLVLLDMKLPGMNGEECFNRLKSINPLTPVIFMTVVHSLDKAVELLKMGAYTYLTKPLRMEVLYHNAANALEKSALEKENKTLQENLRRSFSFEHYTFNAPRMQPVMDVVMRAADSLSNILVTGESGTGKEVIARIIHHYSPRKNQKLVKTNLAALPETLVEAELFGAVKGAYTGALKDRAGRFEEARGGTLFLDEIGELSAAVQVKLLRVIQEREIVRLGTNAPIPIDIRLITASNKDIFQAVQNGTFREDLYYRLNVIHIHLPPLRERKEDIPYLVDGFIEKFNRREDKQVKHISGEAMDALMKYSYPGNIRELENMIERSLVLAKSDMLTRDDLPVFLRTGEHSTAGAVFPQSVGPPPGENDSFSLPEALVTYEKNILSDTLRRFKFNQSRAARALGISEARLRYRMRILNIEKKHK